MEEIYVVKLRHSSDPYSVRPLPSEQRYSATLVLGLGVVHFTLGFLAVFFASLAIFRESEVNQYGAGIWLGIVAMSNGLIGLVAWKKWYLSAPIVIYFISSVVTLVIAILCVVTTIFGIVQRENRLWHTEENHKNSFGATFNPLKEYKVGFALTANIIITSIFECVCCGLSLTFAWKGIRNPKHVPIFSEPTLTNPNRSSKMGAQRLQPLLTLNTNFLIPEIFYRLPNQQCVRRYMNSTNHNHQYNPLWISIPNRLGPDLPSLSTMGYEERVHAYLKEVQSAQVLEIEDGDELKETNDIPVVIPNVTQDTDSICDDDNTSICDDDNTSICDDDNTSEHHKPKEK